jgi:hypothetical protein
LLKRWSGHALARPREGSIDRCCSFAVVVAEQVRVDTQCNIWLGVSQALADGGDIDARVDKLRDVSVPQCVKRHVWHVDAIYKSAQVAD